MLNLKLKISFVILLKAKQVLKTMKKPILPKYQKFLEQLYLVGDYPKKFKENFLDSRSKNWDPKYIKVQFSVHVK